MICITKDTLRQLNAAAGKLDVDTGQVFGGFIGRLEMSDGLGLYHGDVHYSDVGDEPPKDTTSIQTILPQDKAVSTQAIVPPKSPPKLSARSAQTSARTIDTTEE